MAKNGMYGKVCPGCKVPIGHKSHKHGCVPKHLRPGILAEISREETLREIENQQYANQQQAQQAAGAD